MDQSLWQRVNPKTTSYGEVVLTRYVTISCSVVPANEQCIGTQYASMHLAATLGTASVLMDWEHERTPDSDEIQVIAGYVPSPLYQGFR